MAESERIVSVFLHKDHLTKLNLCAQLSHESPAHHIRSGLAKLALQQVSGELSSANLEALLEQHRVDKLDRTKTRLISVRIPGTLLNWATDMSPKDVKRPDYGAFVRAGIQAEIAICDTPELSTQLAEAAELSNARIHELLAFSRRPRYN